MADMRDADSRSLERNYSIRETGCFASDSLVPVEPFFLHRFCQKLHAHHSEYPSVKSRLKNRIVCFTIRIAFSVCDDPFVLIL